MNGVLAGGEPIDMNCGHMEDRKLVHRNGCNMQLKKLGVHNEFDGDKTFSSPGTDGHHF